MKQPLLISLILLSFTVKAQEVKEFFDSKDQKTDSASSYYYVVGTEQALYRGVTRSYYTATNILKAEETYNEKGNLHGPYKEYYENGVIKKQGTHEKVDEETTYYPNGKKQRVITYPKEEQSISKYENIDFEINDYWDSLGNQLIKSGEGFCKCYVNEFLGDEHFIREEGKVTSKMRDGKWRGFKQDILVYEEYFSKGNFIDGVSFKDGKQIRYTDILKTGSYPGGVNEMLVFIKQNLGYPSKARRMGVDGKVFVEFIVDRDGSITNVAILKGVYEALNAEAMRVVRSMPRWDPTFHRGLAVRSKFILPVTFKLQI